MNKIPVHKLSEAFPGEPGMVRYLTEKTEMPKIDYAHKDDYYIFFFIEKGRGRFTVDFKELEIAESVVLCILPGQIHIPTGPIEVRGWIVALDAMLVKDEYKEIFEKFSFTERNKRLTPDEINELRNCVSAIHKRFQPERTHIEETILHDLISYYIGLIAEIYRKGSATLVNNRLSDITYQFKKLLAEHYNTIKSPAQYASLLNISPVYLNEAVKKTTGLNVSDCIRNEIVLQAKRLLYYTTLPVKEIALTLGYDDYAYFTRLFTKTAHVSPTQFRKRYLK